VISREKLSLYTPDPTIVDSEARQKSSSEERRAGFAEAPPSPPLTVQDPDLRRTKSGHSMGNSDFGKKKSRPRSLDGTSMPSQRENSQSPQKSDEDHRNFERVPLRAPSNAARSNLTEDSQATSIPRVPHLKPSDSRSSPHTITDPSPQTPTGLEAAFQTPIKTPSYPSAPPIRTSSGYTAATPSSIFPPSQPPPPPPPPGLGAIEGPKVDYLLQNGGLPSVVRRTFFPEQTPTSATSYASFASPIISPNARNAEAHQAFGSFNRLLDDYLQVIARNGSLAVATGYRSVARKLLDRLEVVFNRNIASESCTCVMCSEGHISGVEKAAGVSWGEVLEYVAGRRELPVWPPFVMLAEQLPTLNEQIEAPMQKLDGDIPEEFRAHYIKQSKKTKLVVQNWLASQPEEPSSPPQEVDDETLAFAIVTHLEPNKRKLFTALLRGMTTVPTSRAPTPLARTRSELMARTSTALTRLYRLKNPPRDSECSLYMLKYPELHSVLATLAVISAQEWDILVSGRFDGFLWSGAEPSGPAASITPARLRTPFSPKTPQTPGAGGAPVQQDEDTEIALLSEIERDIYAGMEALEDAFEALHTKAELVRNVLRQRSGGLAMAASARRGEEEQPEIRGSTPWGRGTGTPGFQSGTPLRGINTPYGVWDGILDDGVDLRSELAPDDSASNISFGGGHRRHGRRRANKDRELRTPASVAEIPEVDEK
jgi:hypothetical protein